MSKQKPFSFLGVLGTLFTRALQTIALAYLAIIVFVVFQVKFKPLGFSSFKLLYHSTIESWDSFELPKFYRSKVGEAAAWESIFIFLRIKHYFIIPSKSYAEDCRIFTPENPKSQYFNITVKNLSSHNPLMIRALFSGCPRLLHNRTSFRVARKNAYRQVISREQDFYWWKESIAADYLIYCWRFRQLNSSEIKHAV